MKKGIDYIGVGVGAVVFDTNKKIFMSLRGKDVRNESGTWEFPGGGVTFGETLESALKREFLEEYGCDIEILTLLDICDHIIPDEKQHWVSPTYIAKIVKGIPMILEPTKCDAIGWFSIKEIQKMNISLISQYNLKSVIDKFDILCRE